jgi:nucleotide-binding universal stress UspA family protein
MTVAGGVICTVEASADATRLAAVASHVADQLGLRLVVADVGAKDSSSRSEAFLQGVAEAAGLHGAELRTDLEGVEAILAVAALEDAELIVVARSGDAWPQLIALADCPVLVIPQSVERRAKRDLKRS